MLLLDIEKAGRRAPAVLASASKIEDEKRSADSLEFHSEGPIDTVCATRLLLEREPKSVTGRRLQFGADRVGWDAAGKTLLITYPNSPDGVLVRWGC